MRPSPLNPQPPRGEQRSPDSSAAFGRSHSVSRGVSESEASAVRHGPDAVLSVEHETASHAWGMSADVSTGRCAWCGGPWAHPLESCPAVRAVEYYPNGALRRVERYLPHDLRAPTPWWQGPFSNGTAAPQVMWATAECGCECGCCVEAGCACDGVCACGCACCVSELCHCGCGCGPGAGCGCGCACAAHGERA